MSLSLSGEFQLGRGQHEAVRGIPRADDFVDADGGGGQCLSDRAEESWGHIGVARHAAASCGGVTRADHSDGGLVEERTVATDGDDGRRDVDGGEAGGI